MNSNSNWMNSSKVSWKVHKLTNKTQISIPVRQIRTKSKLIATANIRRAKCRRMNLPIWRWLTPILRIIWARTRSSEMWFRRPGRHFSVGQNSRFMLGCLRKLWGKLLRSSQKCCWNLLIFLAGLYSRAQNPIWANSTWESRSLITSSHTFKNPNWAHKPFQKCCRCWKMNWS